MSKMKTHKGTSKSFFFFLTGKFMLRHSGKSHILTKKSKKRKNRLGKDIEAPVGGSRKIAKLLAGQEGR